MAATDTRTLPAGAHRSWLLPLVRTSDALAPALLRITLGLVMFPHGAQKMLGWFGGQGFSATLAGFTSAMHIPAPLAVLVIVAEFFGSIALLLGAFTRVAAAGIAAVMVGATVLVHARHGFFMNWRGSQAGEGFEYHILAIGIAVSLMLMGGGLGSVDRALTRWRARRGESKPPRA
jgi:putative oxidoreductase